MLRRCSLFAFSTATVLYAVAAGGCGVDPAYDCTTRGIACGDDGGAKLDGVAPDAAAGPTWTCCDASGDSNGGSEGAADAAPTCADAASFCSATGKCVETSSDPANCGACGKACSPVPNGTVLCQAGACVVGSCTSNFNNCGGLCVREDDPDHCGTSCTKCAGPPSGNGSASCTSGSCGVSCSATYFTCNGDCHSVSADPSDSCVVTETIGVFVAPNGQDAPTNGTRTAPFATIGYAAQHANNRARIYVQAGTYTGAVSLDASAPALVIFGGFDSAWHYDPANQQVKIQTGAGIVPLSITNVASALTLEGIEFDAADANAPGGSSLAAFFTNSPNVTLRKVTLKAGAGMKGGDGVLVPVTYPSATDLQGGKATGNTGGDACSKTCPAGGTTSGGIGGLGGAPAGGDGTSGSPAFGAGVGQTAVQCAGGDGTKLAGASAPAAAQGPKAAASGSVSGAGWTPTSGGNGVAGGPGQGGGGGGGSVSGAGGGGGCGGCGGAAGTGGAGGGGSIALLIVGSTASITLDTCTLAAGKAGAGGNGVAGQTGQTPGGAGGAPAGVGCLGGRGGAGASGGPGGGGAGGISVGIVHQGTAPTLTNTTPSVSSTLAAGGSGAGVNNDGVLGVSTAILSQ